MRRHTFQRTLLLGLARTCGLLAAAVALGAGCAASSPRAATTVPFSPPRDIDVSAAEHVRSEVMGFADTHNARVAQACDELLAIAGVPPTTAVRDYAIVNKVGTAAATMAIATAPNPFVSLLDMVVMVTLKRASVEEHGIPSVLHERGQPLLAAFQQSEREIWAVAGRYLTPDQINDLRAQIEKWRAENPTMKYVGFVRLSDFGAYRQYTRSQQKAGPSSVFSLFYVDPLANLDPVSRELREYRSLSERLAFLLTRMPVLLTNNSQAVVWQATNDPGVQRFLALSEQFALATDRFSKATAKYPSDLALERDAAIKQAAAELTVQRKDLVKDLEQQADKARKVVADVRGVVDAADRMATSLKGSTTEAVDFTERATRRTVNHIFWAALTFAIVCMIGIPLSALGYRACRRRMLVGEAGDAST